MRYDTMNFSTADGRRIQCEVVTVQTLIIGAGAAGLKCADMLHSYGVTDLALVVDRLGNGTSNNSGSDKQTYYKIGLFGDEPDSPMDFARSLFQGGMMHGDLAYIEALGSAPAFFDLCKLGVPFPHNSYGAYVGYKTDHDPRQRATSAGPKTSKFMYERLLAQLRRAGTPILDQHEAIALLYDDRGETRRVVGALCLNKTEHYRDSYGLTVVNACNVVMATGGPGELYKTSVWPHGQLGSHGLALAAGAAANNLTELQFGLASVGFRWNLSGTYQQVIPDYYSTAADGVSERRHFLHDYFSDMPSLAAAIFLKGYQWPFHAARLQDGGSSLVDIAVHREISAGRRVFLDFMKNPTPGEGMAAFAIADLPEEARHYLERSGALQATPYERLQHMNQQSIDLYAEHGVDLRLPLEAAVCAQHCNGGISGSPWWESNLRHLFVIGELCGTHGVRPGGSALNSGQVGAIRAAQRIANVYHAAPMPAADCVALCSEQISAQWQELHRYLTAGADALSAGAVRQEIQARMSAEGAFIRSAAGAQGALDAAKELYGRICRQGFRCRSARELPQVMQNKWLALSSVAFLQAIVSYIEGGGGSRGGYMVLDEEGTLSVHSRRGSELRHREENIAKRQEILELSLQAGTLCDFAVRVDPVRPLPQDDSWYESTWAEWNAGEIFRS
jgi:succinate dehydrogenase/fumarate reductase flavoprotein subunit